MARTRSTWTTRAGRAVLTLIVVGLASSGLAACGGSASSSSSPAYAAASSRAAAISAAVASAAAAETSAAAQPSAAQPSAAQPSAAQPSAAQPTAAAGGGTSQGPQFTDAEACTWLKQELVAVKNIHDSMSVQFNILGSLSDFFDKHGGLANASGSAVDDATRRACLTEHDQLLKKAKLKSFGDL